MSTRAPFLSTHYGGYSHRQIPKEDEELTHVGPGTPGGEYLHRFWQPVIYSEELTDLPVPTRILGEDLVVFRDFSGQVGVLELHCPHRGTSLEFRLVSERGIRCCYHGWLFDVDGAILETPGEPADSTLKDRLCHGAYPVEEHGGAVFVYMGPPEKRPPFPRFDSWDKPGFRLVAGPRYDYPCNWLQIAENAMDPAHTAFLHTIVSGAQFTDAFGVLPKMDYIETPLGLAYIASRRVGDNIWVRMVETISPNVHQVSPVWEDGSKERPFSGPAITMWTVPRDDHNTMQVEFRHVSEAEGETPRWWADRVMIPGQMPDDVAWEQRQRQPGDFDAQVGQRSIARHGLEHLATTDRGVTMFRQDIRRGIQAVREGREPDGLLIQEGDVIPTYANDTVVRVPPAPTQDEDDKLLRETGRKLAEEFVNCPPLSAS